MDKQKKETIKTTGLQQLSCLNCNSYRLELLTLEAGEECYYFNFCCQSCGFVCGLTLQANCKIELTKPKETKEDKSYLG